MNEWGLSRKEYFQQCMASEEEVFRELTRFPEEELEEYKKLLAHLEKVHQKNREAKEAKKKTGRKKVEVYTTGEKGKALENLVSFLITKSSVFKLFENLRNSTNEIDHLLKLNFAGNKFKLQLNFPGDTYLSECKNYNKKVDVTWVGKFYSLLQSNSVRLGLLFSYHGLAGQGEWHSAIGLTKKLFLLREDLEKRIYIIDINIKDFNEITNGKSLLEIIHAKMDGLRFATNFEKFLEEKHPAELEKASKEDKASEKE